MLALDVRSPRRAGANSMSRYGNSPPYWYALTDLVDAPVAATSMTGPDGNDGGRAILHGSDPVCCTRLNLAVDEDRLENRERNQTNEQLADIVFE